MITRLKRMSMCFVLGWDFFRVFLQIIYGAWRISKLSHPIITIFGSSKIAPSEKYVHEANQIASWLVDYDMSVLTGGGPGIMQAANLGAVHLIKKDEIRSIGIGVRGLHENKNMYVQEYFALDYFFARKWLLTQYSTGFIIFPGGFGTLDELSEILTLIQTNQMKKVPIVLIGKDFWDPFMQWLTQQAVPHGLITAEHLKLFSVTDDPYKAFCFVRGQCKIDE
jgi:uncharacterized protein (TIGR00730 family)